MIFYNLEEILKDYLAIRMQCKENKTRMSVNIHTYIRDLYNIYECG